MNTILIRHLDHAHTIKAERLDGFAGIRIIANVPDNKDYKIDEYEMIISNFCWEQIKKALTCADEWEYWGTSNCYINQQNRPQPKWKRGIEKAIEQPKQVTYNPYQYNEFISTYSYRSLDDEAINYQMTLRYSTDLVTPANENNGYHAEYSLKTFQNEGISFPQINCICQEITGHGLKGCKDNETTICYHSITAIIKKAELKDATVNFFDDFNEAVNFSNFDGKLVKVVSAQSGESCWIVVRSKKLRKHQEDTIKKIRTSDKDYIIVSSVKIKINLMRGSIEEGIE